MNGGLFWLENDHIIPITTDGPITVSLGKDIVITDIVEDSNGDLQISSSTGIGYITVTKQGKTLRQKPTDGDRICINLLNTNGQYFLSLTHREGSRDSIVVIYNNKELILPNDISSSFKSKPIQNGQNFYFATGNFLLKYDGKNLTHQPLSGRIWNISLVDDKLWLCTNQKGVIAYDKNTLKPLDEEKLSGLYITSFVKDSNGQTWATTLKSGLIKFNESNIQELVIRDLKNKNFSSIETNNKQDIFINWRTDEFYLGTVAKFNVEKESLNVLSKDIDLIFPMYYSKREDQLLYLKKSNQSTDLVGSKNAINLLLKTTPEAPYLNGAKLIASIGESKYRFFKEIQDSLFVTSKDRISLFRHGEESDYSPSEHDLISDIRAYNMSGKTAFIGTKNKGLIIYNGSQTIQITKNNGLLSNHITAINIPNKDTIYIGTNKGVNRLTRSKNLEYKIDGFIDFTHGLEEIDILDFALLQDKLWVLTEHKLYSIEIQQFNLEPIKGSYVSIAYVESGKHRYTTQDINTFDYSDKNIAFQIDKLNFGWNHNDSIYIKLLGLDREWKQATEGLIQYSGLNHGNYNFLIAPSREEISGNRMISYPFAIAQPFYLQTWFAILSGLLLMLGSYGWSQLKKKREQQEAFKKSEIKRLKMKALMAQINPHFTFNVLNSIQDLILKNEKFEAVDKLGDFSIMIRKILDVTRKSFVPISEDIELLKSYIQFEQLRFHEKFKYHINMDAALKDSVVPPLIIQPLVENAIWHGIKHNTNRPGVISINIIDRDDYILFQISDNGELTEQLYNESSANNDSSKGILLVKQRIAISNDKNFDAHYNMKASKTGMNITFRLQKKS